MDTQQKQIYFNIVLSSLVSLTFSQYKGGGHPRTLSRDQNSFEDTGHIN